MRERERPKWSGRREKNREKKRRGKDSFRARGKVTAIRGDQDLLSIPENPGSKKWGGGREGVPLHGLLKKALGSLQRITH